MFKKLFSSQLRVNMASGVATTVVNGIVLAVGYPIYLHFLGYEQYGIWLVLSVVLSFAQLGDLGIGQAVMKLVAEEYGRGDMKAVRQYISSAVAMVVLSGAVVFSVIVLLRAPIVGLFRLSEENARSVLWLLPHIAWLSLYVFVVQIIMGALSGLGRMDWANYARTGGRALIVLVASILLLCGAGVSSLLVGTAAAYVFSHLMGVVLMRRIIGGHIFRMQHVNLQRSKRLLRFGAGMLGSSIFSMLLMPFNKLMLSRYAGVALVPVYEIAFQGSMQVRALTETAVRALAPEVSRIGANMTEQARMRIRQIHGRAVGLIWCLGLPVFLLLLVLAPWLLRLWLGHGDAVGLPFAFRLALVSSFISLACVPAYYVLLGLGYVRHCLMCQAILAGGNVLLATGWVWMQGTLSVPEVLLSTLLATIVSSAYVIGQNSHILRRKLVPTGVKEEKSERLDVIAAE